MSSRGFKASRRISPVVILGVAILAGHAQYPGQVSKESKDTPVLRAIGVLEWTGDPGKPKTSRLVPITVYDGEALRDGGVYLARPEPMALDNGVEYVLQKNGKAIGLYDIRNAGQEQGSWVGFGKWKSMPAAKPHAPKPIIHGFDPNDDKPVLHRKRESISGSSSESKPSAPAPDPDRPTLHKEPDSSSAGSKQAPDSDQPTLHKPDSGDQKTSDSDRPALHKGRADAGDSENRTQLDPDRPRIIPGKPTGNGPDVLPSLMGVPADMQQAVAVSDATSHAEHQWSYTWANPADEEKMKGQMEDIAREALGLKAPPTPTPKHPAAKGRTKAVPPVPSAELAALEGVQFRVFELAYGSGATMVLSAHTAGPKPQQKFVTLIAQPDLYGNVLVLLKNVTDGAHLDQTPRMHLIDAVDAMADNRGELLFELRGATQRQFALYRVLRGSAEKIFVTGFGEYGMAPGE